MKTIWLWVVCFSSLALAAPLPKTPQELLKTTLCQRYQCYALPIPPDKIPATEQGAGTYLFFRKLKGSLFIRSKEGRLTALGWNLPVASAKPTPTQTELNQALTANQAFIQDFARTFFGSPTFYNLANCLKPQTTLPTVKLEGQTFEISCYFSSGELLFTGSVK
jgi:hypothetical protein